MTPPIYEECFLERVENVQKYQAGGFHPISVGQIMKGGPYEIVHKLGYGGIATVWLARDLAPDCGNRALGPLVCLKVISATHSLDAIEASAEVEIPRILLGTSAIDDETRHFIRTHILHNDEPFIEHGPNGSHLCVVSEIAGPSISDVYSNAHVTGRTLGSVRLRADLALKIAGQVTRFVHAMHTAGCVHGDLKASNVLFHLAGGVQNWTSENIYETLGEPDTEALDRLDEHAMEVPIEVVMPIDASKFIDAGLVDWERVVITDFGQSYMIEGRPTNYTPATAVNYRAPETSFENQFTTATDVWSLGCLFFQIRAGFPLFDPWCSTTASILCEIVYLLGKLPEPWWSSFTDRSEYFDDNGNPKLQGGRKNIRAQLYSIGTEDFPPHPGKQDGPMFEPLGTRLSEEEVDLMDDLLGKMLKLRPEERITMDEVVRHPWFLHHDRVIQAKHNPEKLVTQAEIVRPSWLSFQTTSVISV